MPRVRDAIEAIRRDKRRARFRQQLEELMAPGLFHAASPLETRDAIISELTQQLVQRGWVNDAFERDILEREQLSSTAFGTVAVPHTMKPCAQRSSISVLIPREPVSWGGRRVELVLMLSFSRRQRATFNEIIDPLISILLDPANVQSLRAAQNERAFLDPLITMLP